MTWQQHAACAGTDPEHWFDPHLAPRTQALCYQCPVVAECAAYADRHAAWGMWGGRWRGIRHHTATCRRCIATFITRGPQDTYCGAGCREADEKDRDKARAR